MAHQLYDERRFDELPILADALEEAGCSEDSVLAHLRSGGPHARGCWVLDLLRAKLVCALQPWNVTDPQFGHEPLVVVTVRNVTSEPVPCRPGEPLAGLRLVHVRPDGELHPADPVQTATPRPAFTLAPGESCAEPISLWAGLPGPPGGPGTYTTWAALPQDSLEVVSAPLTSVIPAPRSVSP
jgi:hypothetical protein